jgi:Rha family phage regulatory protein
VKNLALHPEYKLYEINGEPRCSSLQVAEIFKKQHAHVIRDIEQKIFGIAPADFTASNFGLSDYKDESGKKNKHYLLTYDAFNLVVMGFTGERAMQYKVDFIRRFNEYATQIAEYNMEKLETRPFTDAIALTHGEPKSYHFSNEFNMINRIVLGMDAKHFLEAIGIEGVSSIRPYLSAIQMSDIRALQMADVGFLVAGMDYSERKAKLIEYHSRRKIIKLSA